MRWHPKTWQDILNAALTIKRKDSGVTPMWADGGTSQGTVGVFIGVGNLLAASADPTIDDTATKKWIVDSPGLRETFNFIHELTVDGLNAAISYLSNPNVADGPALW